MHHVPLTSDESENWSRVVATSDDAWFWHSMDWLAFVKALGTGTFVEDMSFLIYCDRELLAICPVILEARDGYRRFSYMGEFIPFPAFRPGIAQELRLQAIEYYAQTLEELAAANDVAYTRVAVPALARTSTAGKADWNPLLRHGYLDVATASQVISLSEPEEALWTSVRKGHRSDIKRAKGLCQIRFWDRERITTEKFEEYRRLHARDVGRVTRSSATFEMMLAWIRRGGAVLVEACHAGSAVAFALLILFRDRAYYASSCRDPDLTRLSAVHLIQWESILWLKSHGHSHYDIGIQYFGPRWGHVPTAAEISIARFKRGFGGATQRVDTVERFYSASVLERVGATRLKALISAQSAAAADAVT
jgi:hypothetical protein